MFEFIEKNKFALFFAGTGEKTTRDYLDNTNSLRLLSYVNDKNLIIKRCENNQKTFMDSGAFSAFTRGININIDEYIDFINKYSSNLHLFAQWDTIPNKNITPKESAEKTMQNYIYMKDKIKEHHKLVYVFHYGEPYEYLEYALNNLDIHYIALGGIAKKHHKARRLFIDECFKVIKASKKPDIFVHGFGVTDVSLLEEFPFSSADSTSWGYGRYGLINTKTKKWLVISDRRKEQKIHFNYLKTEEKESILKEIAFYNFTYKELEENTTKRNLYNIKTFINWLENYKYKGNI